MTINLNEFTHLFERVKGLYGSELTSHLHILTFPPRMNMLGEIVTIYPSNIEMPLNIVGCIAHMSKKTYHGLICTDIFNVSFVKYMERPAAIYLPNLNKYFEVEMSLKIGPDTFLLKGKELGNLDFVEFWANNATLSTDSDQGSSKST